MSWIRTASSIAPEYASLKANSGLTIKVGPDGDRTYEETFKQSVAAAAQVFTLEEKVADPEQLRSVLGTALRIQVSDQPDYWEDFDEGRKLLLAKTLDGQLKDSEKFWLRTFSFQDWQRPESCRGHPFVSKRR